MPTMKDAVIELLRQRGVEIRDIAEIVYDLQRHHNSNLTLEQCVESVLGVIGKREAQHAILTGIALDMLAEGNALPEPINSIVRRDEPLYGVDEILALAVTNIYGSIGLTSFGYLDKMKMGIIGRLNNGGQEQVNTFLDDLVAGVAAAAAARIAHQQLGVPINSHPPGNAGSAVDAAPGGEPPGTGAGTDLDAGAGPAREAAVG